MSERIGNWVKRSKLEGSKSELFDEMAYELLEIDKLSKDVIREAEDFFTNAPAEVMKSFMEWLDEEGEISTFMEALEIKFSSNTVELAIKRLDPGKIYKLEKYQEN